MQSIRTCHHHQAPVAGEFLPQLSPSRGYPSPSLPHKECLARPGCPGSASLWGTEELGRKESSPGDREGSLPAPAHTCAAPGHSEGFTPASAGTQQHSWHLPTPERDPGLFWPFHQASWHTCGRVGTVCNLTKGCNRRIQQKKAKTYKTSSWNTYSKMINHANAARGEYRKKPCKVQLSDLG